MEEPTITGFINKANLFSVQMRKDAVQKNSAKFKTVISSLSLFYII